MSDEYKDPVVLRHVPSTAIFRDDIFKGKVLFCTGGGSGICFGMVRAIMAHGAHAAIVGRNAERLQKAAAELQQSGAHGARCIATPADVRKEEALREAVRKTVETFGRIDFVICGAAGNFLAPLEGLSSNAFNTVQQIDLMGTYNTMKATLDELKKTHGAYIHITATLHHTGIPWQAPASAAKAAIESLSQGIAVEMGPHGVRSNCIAPGIIKGTEGAERLTPKGAEDYISASIPMGRPGDVDDIANAGVYLFSDAASYITGTRLIVDGGALHGKSAWLPYPDSSLNQKEVASVVLGSKL
ncbi:2,4-dienoyl-CoA reductase [Tilletiopsis washingtonensis]|uniref:2,4-dienoyl-CoA reductase [(3E)-enoyl-CoA-producing] n=1 Tax=Tilletiopsis washingtonensis TaxID=58919 RepID=A0A316Z723_9BASI|nr:2,4-dienoyl-CoA reductase [Tilletiopsis washingtonensis]PWN97399.1 2,4-dienoyl-CoA reductase [Tilletiopsis washingtonensis]